MAIQIIEKIKEIKQLLDEGILTQEEFNVEKAKLMEKYVKPIQGDTQIQSKLVQSEESQEVRELRELKEQGIEARSFWKPVHLQKPYEGCFKSSQAVAESLWQRIITLPCSTGITESEVSEVRERVEAICTAI